MSDFVSFQTIQKFHKIAYKYNPLSGNKIITIVDNNPTAVKAELGLSGKLVWVNALLEELHVKSRIRSLREVSLPEYDYVDPQSGMLIRVTETERIQRTLQYEWETDRFELRVYCSALGDWVEYGAVALKHSGGHRYRIHRLLDLITENVGAKLGDYGKIGFQVLNVGYGAPQAGDEIEITGHWTQEICLSQGQPLYVIVNNYSSSSTPTPTPTPTPPVTYNPTLTLALPTGKTNAGIYTSTRIDVTGNGFPPNTVVSLIWMKGDVETGTSSAINTGTAGSFTTFYNAGTFGSSGAGTYKLKASYGTTLLYSGTVTVIDDTPTVRMNLPTGITQASIPANTAISIVGSNFNPNTSLTIDWLKNNAVVYSGSVTTDANGTYTYNFNASAFEPAPFNGAGTYKIRLIQSGVSFTSNEIIVLGADITIAPTSSTIESALTLNIHIRNFAANDAITTTWVKGTTVLTATAVNRTCEANGNLFISFNCGTFNNSPYNGAGDYKLRVTKGSKTYDSNTVTMTVPTGGGGGSLS